MFSFSIPYNHDPKMLEEVLPNPKISEVYLPCSPRIMGSGRSTFKTEEAIIKYEKELPSLIELIHSRSAKVNMLFNALEYNEWDQKYAEYLKKYKIDSVTLANPIFVKPIKENLPHLIIHASVNAFIFTVERAMYWKELGADVIAIPDEINKDIELIKKIKEATKAKIKVILNSTCTYGCPFTPIHQMGLGTQKIRDHDPFVGIRCNRFGTNPFCSMKSRVEAVEYMTKMAQEKSPQEINEMLKKIATILPQEFQKYKGVVDIFKIISRHTPSKELIPGIKTILAIYK